MYAMTTKLPSILLLLRRMKICWKKWSSLKFCCQVCFERQKNQTKSKEFRILLVCRYIFTPPLNCRGLTSDRVDINKNIWTAHGHGPRNRNKGRARARCSRERDDWTNATWRYNTHRPMTNVHQSNVLSSKCWSILRVEQARNILKNKEANDKKKHDAIQNTTSCTHASDSISSVRRTATWFVKGIS